MKLLKKLSAILLAIMLLFGSMPMADLGLENLFSSIAFAVAEDNEEEEEKIDTKKDYVYGDFIYGYTKSGEIVIRKYMGNEKEVTVPGTIDGTAVTEIGDFSFCPTTAYENYDTDTEYSNPDSANIETVHLPDSVTYIAIAAFMYCENLTEIIMPKNLEYIGHSAFGGCSSLENINLPHGIEVIEGFAFAETKIKSLTIISDSKDFTAEDCMLADSIVENLTIKAKTVNIVADTLLDNKTLKSLTLEGTINLVKDSIVSDTLESLTLIGVVDVGENSIVSDTLENLTIIGTVSVGANSISCKSLKNLTIDGTITSFSESAFGGDLAKAKFPKTVEIANFHSYDIYKLFVDTFKYIGDVVFTDKIEKYMFKRPENTGVVEEGDYQYYINDDGEAVLDKYIGNYSGTVDVFVPETLGGAPVTVIGHQAFSNINTKIGSLVLPATVTHIEDEAFAGGYFTKIRIGKNLESLGDRAFMNCHYLTAVGYYESFEEVAPRTAVLPDTLTVIPTCAFGGCSNLDNIQAKGVVAVLDYGFSGAGIFSVEFSDDFFWVGEHAFWNCYSLSEFKYDKNTTFIGKEAFRNAGLRSFEFNENITEIGDYAFNSCDFETLTIPSNIKKIGDYAYSKCEKLVTLKFSDSDVELGEYVFEGCTALKNIEFSKSVTEIPKGTFNNCKSLETVVIPDSVTTIGESAFERCAALKNLKISNSIATISKSTFRYCNALESVVIPESVTVIDEYAFDNCIALKNLEIADSVKTIGEHAFSYCEDLESVEIPDSVTTIGKHAFAYCFALKELKISNSVETISKYTFYNCGKLKSVTIPDSVTKIEDCAFENCQSLEELELSDSVETIGYLAFSSCNSLKELNLPGSVTTIGTSAFYYCKSLESIDFSDSLVTIGRDAFRNCIALKTIDLPDSLTTIQDSAFDGCRSLTGELVIPKNVVSIGFAAFRNTKYTVLQYNAVSGTGVSSNAFQDSLIETVNLGEGVRLIPKRFFSKSSMESITLPESLEIIEEYAFYNCKNLKSIVIPESVTTIAQNTFKGCTSITEFNIPRKLTELRSNMLPPNVTTVYYNAENCKFPSYSSPFDYTKVTNIVIGDNVKRIPDYMFANLDTIDEIILPDSVTEIGSFAFNCSSIKKITLPENLIVIEDYAFGGTDVQIEGNAFPEGMRMIGTAAFIGCESLEEIYIPDSVVNIAEYAFEDCTNLKKVRMSSNVKLISTGAFRNCPKLEEFIWDSDVKLIADYAFYNSKSLKNFDFAGVELIYPNSFTDSGVTAVTLGHDKNDEATDLIMIETQSFMGCENLDTVAIGGNVTTIKSEAFASCSSLETVIIADSVVNIAGNAFDDCSEFTIYCEEGSYAQKFAEKKGIPVSTFVVAPIPNQTYTGYEIEPEIDVSVSGEKVMENTDFTVKYSNNINVGLAKVTVSGKGAYKVLSSIANFTIITKNIAPVTFAPISEQDYTGEAVIPTLTVTDGNRVLKEGVDYTVTFKNNVNEGTATATIQGIGNYHGTASTSFQIREMSTSQSASNKILDFFTSLWLKIVSFFTSIFN